MTAEEYERVCQELRRKSESGRTPRSDTLCAREGALGLADPCRLAAAAALVDGSRKPMGPRKVFAVIITGLGGH